MKEITKNLIFWAPRVLSMLFACFLGLFAADVFNENLGFWQEIKALLIHLLPSLLILLVLCVAWRWEIVATLGYSLLAIYYVVSTWGRFPFSVYLVIVLPLLVIAMLFFISWLYHDELSIRKELFKS
jgi:hypothetical protein